MTYSYTQISQYLIGITISMAGRRRISGRLCCSVAPSKQL
jgi:hypothetical protein